MAGRAEQDKIPHVVVVALAIQVSDLQHVRYAEPAMRAEQPVVVVRECELAIVDAFHVEYGHRHATLFFAMPLQETLVMLERFCDPVLISEQFDYEPFNLFCPVFQRSQP